MSGIIKPLIGEVFCYQEIAVLQGEDRGISGGKCEIEKANHRAHRGHREKTKKKGDVIKCMGSGLFEVFMKSVPRLKDGIKRIVCGSL